MTSPPTIQLPWFLTRCISASSGWVANNDWNSTTDTPNGLAPNLPKCGSPADVCAESGPCNFPGLTDLPPAMADQPSMCFVDSIISVTSNDVCPPGYWSCGQRMTGPSNESFNDTGSATKGRICAQADVSQCPVLGAGSVAPVSASAASFITGTVSDGSFDWLDLENQYYVSPMVPQPVNCVYDAGDVSRSVPAMQDLLTLSQSWETSLTNAGIPSPYPGPAGNPATTGQATATVNAMPATVQALTDSVLGPYCSQLASSIGLPNTACPTDLTTTELMEDCLLFSVDTAGQENDVGAMCRSWCNSSQNCDQYIVSGCKNAVNATPSGAPILAGDCKCVSRDSDPNFAYIYENMGENTGVPAPARCWYFPCVGEQFSPYLMTQADLTATCPCFDYCEQIDQIVAGPGSQISNVWFQNYIKDCQSDQNNCGDGGGSPGDSPGAPPGTVPSGPAPSPGSVQGIPWKVVGIVAAVLVAIFFLYLVFRGSFATKTRSAQRSPTATKTPPSVATSGTK